MPNGAFNGDSYTMGSNPLKITKKYQKMKPGVRISMKHPPKPLKHKICLGLLGGLCFLVFVKPHLYNPKT